MPATRQSPGRRGLYDHTWRKLRLAFLAEHPLCLFCEQEGRTTAARQVDHIKTVREHPELRLEWTNLRPLCDSHHSRHTWADTHRRANPHPPFLRPASIPVAVVCGPPAGGKSHWVASRARPGELVLDLDAIVAELQGSEAVRHDWDRSRWLHPALHYRNTQLGRLSGKRPEWSRAWLIVGEPRAMWREWWSDVLRPERIVVLETSAEQCVAWAASDADRSAAATDFMARRWWAAYARRPGDEVISWGPGPSGHAIALPQEAAQQARQGPPGSWRN